jgi:superfamily I DNA/RNA helicase
MTEKIKIFGGPGCDKTTIIKEFYPKYLLYGYKPTEITVLIFRKTAAADLIDATISCARMEEKELKQYVGTIHSICYRLIGRPEKMEPSDYADFVKKNNYGKYLKNGSYTAKIDDMEESVYSGDLFDLYSWLRNTCAPFDKWNKYPGAKNIKIPSNKVTELLKNY